MSRAAPKGEYSELPELDLTKKDDMELLRAASRDRHNAERIEERHLGHLVILSLEGNLRALQVLYNTCFHLPSSRKAVAGDAGSIQGLLENAQKLAGEAQLLTLRLLFLVTIEAEGGSVCNRNEGFVGYCYECLALDNDICLFALRILYNLEKGIARKDRVDKLWAVAASSRHSMKIRGSAINVLLHADAHMVGMEPADFLDLFKALSSADSRVFADYAPSFYLLSARLCLVRPGLGRTLRRELLCCRRGRSPEHRRTIAAQLACPFTDAVIALGDFLLTILDNSVSRLIFHFGLEGAAGYLYMRGMEPGAAAEAGDRAAMSSDEEALAAQGTTGKDLFQTQAHGQHAESIEMTDQEKEAEAERLVQLIERMERSGVIKTINK